MSVGTDLEVPVEPTPPELLAVGDMSDRELIEECVVNQRVMIRQFGEIVTAFGDIQQAIQQGGIAGLLKGLMGRG